MAEAVGRPFVHVTSEYRDHVGMWRDQWGDGGATCKIAGMPSQVRILSLPHYLELRKRAQPSDQAGFDAPVPLRFPSTRRPAHTVGIRGPGIPFRVVTRAVLPS